MNRRLADSKVLGYAILSHATGLHCTSDLVAQFHTSPRHAPDCTQYFCNVKLPCGSISAAMIVARSARAHTAPRRINCCTSDKRKRVTRPSFTRGSWPVEAREKILRAERLVRVWTSPIRKSRSGAPDAVGGAGVVRSFRLCALVNIVIPVMLGMACFVLFSCLAAVRRIVQVSGESHHSDRLDAS